MRPRPRDSGFSFIELLAYMAIAMLLVLAAVPQFHNYRGRAIDSNALADVRSVAAGMEAWSIDHPGEAFPHIRYRWMAEADDGTSTLSDLGVRLSPNTELWVDDRTEWPYPTDVTAPGAAFCIFAVNQHGSRYTWWTADGSTVAAWNSNTGGIGHSCSDG